MHGGIVQNKHVSYKYIISFRSMRSEYLHTINLWASLCNLRHDSHENLRLSTSSVSAWNVRKKVYCTISKHIKPLFSGALRHKIRRTSLMSTFYFLLIILQRNSGGKHARCCTTTAIEYHICNYTRGKRVVNTHIFTCVYIYIYKCV